MSTIAANESIIGSIKITKALRGYLNHSFCANKANQI